jgi:hypothetical protein
LTGPRRPVPAFFFVRVAGFWPRPGTAALLLSPVLPRSWAAFRSSGSSPRSVSRTRQGHRAWRSGHLRHVLTISPVSHFLGTGTRLGDARRRPGWLGCVTIIQACSPAAPQARHTADMAAVLPLTRFTESVGRHRMSLSGHSSQGERGLKEPAHCWSDLRGKFLKEPMPAPWIYL